MTGFGCGLAKAWPSELCSGRSLDLPRAGLLVLIRSHARKSPVQLKFNQENSYGAGC